MIASLARTERQCNSLVIEYTARSMPCAGFAISNDLTARPIRDAIHIHPSMTEPLQTLFRKVG